MAADRELRGDVVTAPEVRSGSEGELVLDLWWSGQSVDAVEATLHGLAGARLALEGGRAVVRPGLRRRVVGALRLPAGLTPGRYDLAVELRCQLDVDVVLLIPVTVQVIAPPAPTVRVERVRLRGGQGRCNVVIDNPNAEPERVALTAAGRRLRFRFEPPVVEVPAHGTAKARLWVRSGGRRGRFVVTAATATTQSTAAATVRSRRDGAIALVIVAVLLAVLSAIGSPTTGLSRENGLSALGGGLASAPIANHALSDFEEDLLEAQGAVPTTIPPPSASDVPVVIGADGLPVDPATGSGIPDDDAGAVFDPNAPPVVVNTCTGEAASGPTVRGQVVADAPAVVAVRRAGEARESAATALADDKGDFEVCGLPAGDYLVEARAEGYNTLVVSVPVARTDVDLGPLRLQPGAATVLGTVIGPGGPVEGALAAIELDGVEVGWARTNVDGEFLVLGVPAPANAVLLVEAVGFLPAERPVSVRVPDRLRMPAIILQQSA
ncbi:MAG: carboxypeptidase regulatory-like domain-containing protein [Acidimicrobiia bacterium]|nr:carboxypeptidase regulatory-like domain-containing protein [Acidimicrobiia bacterium]